MEGEKNKKIQATGVILAGGRSRRMGADKALLKVGNSELINSVASEMQKIVSEILIVCSNDQVRELPFGRVIKDIYAGRGPLGGIHAALKQARYPYCMVAACDMPFFDANIGEYLLKQVAGYDAVVPIVNAFPEPLFAVYGKGCLIPAEQRLSGKENKITGIYADLRINYIDEKSLRRVGDIKKAFFNVNTYEDFQVAKRMQGRHGKIPVVAVAGWSNSGKTTLLEKLILELKDLGIKLAVVKHHGKPGLELDVPGKDTWRFARAGADAVVLAAPGGMITYNYSYPNPNLEDVLYQIGNVDIILVEGYKHAKTKKILMLGGKNQPVIAEDEIIAVVGWDERETTEAPETPATLATLATQYLDRNIPHYTCNDVKELAAYIAEKFLEH